MVSKIYPIEHASTEIMNIYQKSGLASMEWCFWNVQIGA